MSCRIGMMTTVFQFGCIAICVNLKTKVKTPPESMASGSTSYMLVSNETWAI